MMKINNENIRKMFSVMLRSFKKDPFKRKIFPTKPFVEAFTGNLHLKS